LSSRDPNLQNIPVRSDDGRKIREAFVPGEGCVFMSADYSQIELVVLADLSRDSHLVAAFREGRDVHRQTAALLFGIDESEVDADRRRIGKTINFGVIYGMSAFRLARDLRIPRSEAARFIEAYFRTYSGVDAFIRKTVQEAERQGYVETFTGRRRYVSAIASRNRTEKRAAERVAVNSPIQGSAADIVKRAMIDVAAALHRSGLEARILLQVHDELILEVPEQEIKRVERLVRTTMERAVTFDVPLRVSIEVGESWGAIH
jgi:DNA polymerase-1